MARRPQPVKYLIPELQAAIAHSPEIDWKDGNGPEYMMSDHDDLVGSLDSQGSANWVPLAHASRLLRLTGGKFQKERSAWLAFFEASRARWMGREVGSRVYFGWHFLPVCAVWESAERAGDIDLATAAKNWLLYAAAWFGTVTDDHGQLYFLGQRSAGHPPVLRWFDALCKVIVSGHDNLNSYKSDGWEDDYLKALAPKLFALTKRLHGNREVAKAMLREMNWKTATTYHLYKTADGMAVWTDSRINGNTDAVLARVNNDWLPPNCGHEEGVDRRPGHAECVWVNNELRYTSVNYGNHSLAIPSGTPVEYFIWGGELGYKDLLAITPPAPPVPVPPTPQPQPPKPSKKKSFLEKLIEALKKLF